MDPSNFEKVINDCLKSCTSTEMSTGPMPRWQRKLQAQSNARPLSPLVNGSDTPAKRASCITPGKVKSGVEATKKTPGRNASLNKSGNAGCATYDRFIPNRSLMDNDRSHLLLMRDEKENDSTVNAADHSDASYMESMRASLVESNSKILTMKCKAPTSTDGHMKKILYSQNKKSAGKWKSSRHIPDTPERILDAPDITNDYYLNILDWGNNNCIGTALGCEVFIWHAETGMVDQLMQTGDNDIVTSVKWINEGNVLAVGLNNGTVEIWDAEHCKKKRSMTGHTSRVGSLSWNSYILSSGSRNGAIHLHDVRVAQHNVATLAAHTQEVCGLAWSPSGSQLASGSNDNILNIWDVNLQSSGEINEPLHTMSDHCAAVKAVSWCPWQHNILASGGGTADRHIRIWNTSTGACLHSTDTMSQISGILWSEEHKELVSGHGFSENQLTIWKYPNMNIVTQLTGHTSRILTMTQSPDQSMIASASADQTIRIWNCFAAKKKAGKVKAKTENMSRLMGIR